MKVFGIELKHPSTRELSEAAILICIWSALVALAHYAGIVDSGSAFPMVLGGAVGVLTSTFGASVLRHGWRAIVLLAAIGMVTYVALTLAGVF